LSLNPIPAIPKRALLDCNSKVVQPIVHGANYTLVQVTSDGPLPSQSHDTSLTSHAIGPALFVAENFSYARCTLSSHTRNACDQSVNAVLA
jgi:hypothetical protein